MTQQALPPVQVPATASGTFASFQTITASTLLFQPSGSSQRAGTEKGTTTTKGSESEFSLNMGISVGGVGLGASGSEKSYSSSQRVDMTTSDASTERRETQGYSTQLSQMYQLFNGYHLGTNRALFAIFARPHTKTDSEQLSTNLINGERRLEAF